MVSCVVVFYFDTFKVERNKNSEDMLISEKVRVVRIIIFKKNIESEPLN